MPSVMTKDQIAKINWVQNVSGAHLNLPGFSEDGKGSMVVKKDEVFEIDAYLSQAAKARCRSLQRALTGLDNGDGTYGKPLLVPVKGPNDRKVVKTIQPGSTLDRRDPNPHGTGRNEYDVKIMEQRLKEMEDELETFDDESKREEMQDRIDRFKEKIEKAKKEAEKERQVKVVSAPQAAPPPPPKADVGEEGDDEEEEKKDKKEEKEEDDEDEDKKESSSESGDKKDEDDF